MTVLVLSKSLADVAKDLIETALAAGDAALRDVPLVDLLAQGATIPVVEAAAAGAIEKFLSSLEPAPGDEVALARALATLGAVDAHEVLFRSGAWARFAGTLACWRVLSADKRAAVIAQLHHVPRSEEGDAARALLVAAALGASDRGPTEGQPAETPRALTGEDVHAVVTGCAKDWPPTPDLVEWFAHCARCLNRLARLGECNGVTARPPAKDDVGPNSAGEDEK